MAVEDLSVLWFPIWTRELREEDYEGCCVRWFIVAEEGANQEVDLLETGGMFCVFADNLGLLFECFVASLLFCTVTRVLVRAEPDPVAECGVDEIGGPVCVDDWDVAAVHVVHMLRGVRVVLSPPAGMLREGVQVMKAMGA